MKNLLRLFIVMFCGAAAMTLTSCLNSDDDSSSYIDETYQTQLQAKMSGYYTGRLLFYKSKTDGSSSLDDNYKTISPVTWNVHTPALKADSTITVNATDIASGLSSAIKSDETYTKYTDLVNAMNTSASSTTSILYAVPYTNAVTTTAIYFNANMYVKVMVNYGDSYNYVYYVFSSQSGYYAGSWTSSTSMSMSFVLYNVYLTTENKEFTELKSSDAVDSSYLRNMGVILTTSTTDTTTE